MYAKISVFVICIEVIIYLLLYNLHDCTFNFKIYHGTIWLTNNCNVLTFAFLEKFMGIVSPPPFVYDFSSKTFFMLYFIN